MTEPSRGVRAIFLYKALKAGLQLLLALLLLALLPRGLPETLHALAGILHQHVTHAWARDLAALLERGSTRHGVVLAIVALGLDGTLTAVEAAALHGGRSWGAWLVVIATGALLPFELFELLRSLRPSRALVLLLNLAIVLYLARRAGQERAARQRAPGGP